MTTTFANPAKSTRSSLDTLNAHERALLAPVFKWGRGVYLTIGGLGAVIAFGIYAYFVQLRNGLSVTGMGDTVSWGVYITNFVFFIGISHVGALLSSILRLTGADWRHPITRMAEAITFAALLMGALMPIIDLGRPERVLNLILHGRLQSPILWDIISITTYLAGSTIFLLLPLIPDMALLRDKFTDAPTWRRWIYKIFSFGWRGTPEQHIRLERSMNAMAILILPIAVMVHTVVSWIFAMTLRSGWNSTIFGPYFVAGALASGAASVILAMVIFRRMYHLDNFITPKHFKNMATLVLTLDLVYIYFNIAEYVTAAYKMEGAEKAMLTDLFSGQFSGLFWFAQIFGLLIPVFLLALPMFKPFTWLKRIRLLRPIPLFAFALVSLAVSFTPAFIQSMAGFDLARLTFAFRLIAFLLAGLAAISLVPVLQAWPIASFVIASGLIVVQAWIKRFIIVVPVLQHPFIPLGNSSLGDAIYNPTWVEWAITAGAMAGFLLIYFLLSRMFPIVSVWETAHDKKIEEPVRGSIHSLAQPATTSSPEI